MTLLTLKYANMIKTSGEVTPKPYRDFFPICELHIVLIQPSLLERREYFCDLLFAKPSVFSLP